MGKHVSLTCFTLLYSVNFRQSAALAQVEQPRHVILARDGVIFRDYVLFQRAVYQIVAADQFRSDLHVVQPYRVSEMKAHLRTIHECVFFISSALSSRRCSSSRSTAHKGLMYLADNVRSLIEVLREPLEDSIVRVTIPYVLLVVRRYVGQEYLHGVRW